MKEKLQSIKEEALAQIQALKSVRWFVDCGDDDFLLDRNIEFFQAMRWRYNRRFC